MKKLKLAVFLLSPLFMSCTQEFIENEFGEDEIVTRNIEIEYGTPVGIAGDANAFVGFPVTYSLLGNYSIQSIKWEINGIEVSRKKELVYTFTNEGVYEIKCSGFLLDGSWQTFFRGKKSVNIRKLLTVDIVNKLGSCSVEKKIWSVFMYTPGDCVQTNYYDNTCKFSLDTERWLKCGTPKQIRCDIIAYDKTIYPVLLEIKHNGNPAEIVPPIMCPDK